MADGKLLQMATGVAKANMTRKNIAGAQNKCRLLSIDFPPPRENLYPCQHTGIQLHSELLMDETQLIKYVRPHAALWLPEEKDGFK
jgi:hypothetical protein